MFARDADLALLPMKALRERLPSWQQVFLLFIAVSFPVNLWAIINFLRALPSFLLRLRWREIVLVASYAQAFALLEGFFVLAVVLLLGFLLPAAFIRDDWVAKGTVLIWITSIWAASYHFFPAIFPVWNRFVRQIFRLINLSMSDEKRIILGMGVFLGIWVSLYFLVLTFCHRLGREKQLHSFITRIQDRIRVLTLLYVVVDIIGGLIVAVHIVA